jgi:TRAP-type C4-dicarboxylate transport system substrate-binding protein
MRRSFVVAAIAAALGGGAALAQDKPVELKFSHWVPPTHPMQKTGIEPWAKSIAEASGGSIKITIYPAQQLGKAPDHYDMARDGIVDIAYVNPGYQAGRFPIIAGAELPFMVKNAIGGSAAIDAWYRAYAEREMGDVKVCMAYAHDPGALHSKKEIRSPDQIRGMKVRPANGTIAQFMTSLGGTNVQVSAPEARDALEKGVAEAITFPWSSLFIFGIDKVTSHHMDVPFYVPTFVLPINKDAYGRLSANQKKVIDAHCTTEWAEKFAKGWALDEAAGRVRMSQTAGHTLVGLSDAEVAVWRKAAEPLTAKWAEGAARKGVKPDDVLGALKKELAARGAQY